ncbi:hypothetical protein ACFX2F_026033 [Malus domestica]
MRQLAASCSLPWLIRGGFNELLGIHEKEWGPIRLMNQIMAFRNAVYDCHLHDLGFLGTPYTWITTRAGGIKERLDRMMATDGWKDLFSTAKVTHLDPSKSDHVPILLELDGPHNCVRRRSKMFRFENFWADHEECEGIIRDAWNKPGTVVLMFQIVNKIKATRVALLKWKQSVFKGRQEEIKELRQKLGFILAQPLTNDALVEQHQLMQRLDQLLGQEEKYWKQRS